MHIQKSENTSTAWPTGLLDRIKAAEQRVQNNSAPRSIPADPHSDVDLVLAEVRYLIEGRWPPFWIKDDSEAPSMSKSMVKRMAHAPAAPSPNCRWCDAPEGTEHHKSCPAFVMTNGLTEAETDATASVFGLTRDAEPTLDGSHYLGHYASGDEATVTERPASDAADDARCKVTGFNCHTDCPQPCRVGGDPT